MSDESPSADSKVIPVEKTCSSNDPLEESSSMNDTNSSRDKSSGTSKEREMVAGRSSSSIQPISNVNISLDEISDELRERLNGDRIGDTLYSESFVLRTLMHLSDVKWSSELEDELCFLWDISEELDICNYLLSLRFPSTVCFAIDKYPQETRLLEILLGILGNILSVVGRQQPNADIQLLLNNTEIEQITDLIHTVDQSSILIQVIRILHAVVFNAPNVAFIKQYTMDALCYILSNSTVAELLFGTIRLFACLTSDCKLPEHLLTANCIASVTVAYREINSDADSVTCDDMDNSQKVQGVRYYIDFVWNVCTLIETCNNRRLLNELNSENRSIVNSFVDDIIYVVEHYCQADDFRAPTDELRFCVDALTYIFRVLTIGYRPKLLIGLHEFIYMMIDLNSGNQTDDDMEVFAQFYCYLIKVGVAQTIANDLTGAFGTNSLKIRTVLNGISARNLTFDFEYMQTMCTVAEMLNIKLQYRLVADKDK